uniref:Uncharacterized protein n=1 Tax=Stegastes partitus TaxID=144197 RepID=A0A3B5A6P2_9TELE
MVKKPNGQSAEAEGTEEQKQDFILSGQTLFCIVCIVSCPKWDYDVTVISLYSDVSGNEWKTRYETQVELNGQLERQISLIHERLEDIRGNPMGK